MTKENVSTITYDRLIGRQSARGSLSEIKATSQPMCKTQMRTLSAWAQCVPWHVDYENRKKTQKKTFGFNPNQHPTRSSTPLSQLALKIPHSKRHYRCCTPVSIPTPSACAALSVRLPAGRSTSRPNISTMAASALLGRYRSQQNPSKNPSLVPSRHRTRRVSPLPYIACCRAVLFN